MSKTTQEVVDKFQSTINARSGGGVLGLGRSFRIIDKDKSGQLSLSEFKQAMVKFRMNLTNEEMELLFKNFDKDNSGTVKFEEFLSGLRSSLAPQRKALVEQAFNLFDTDRSGELNADDLAQKYDVSKHPKVKNGEWTPKQALDEFLKVFEGGGAEKNGIVTKDEWIDYHTGLSANIDNDDEFGMLMANNWGIEFIPQAEINKIFSIIREKAAQKGGDKNPKRMAAQMFKYFDTNNTNSIDYDEFCKAMDSFSSGLNPKALKTLFQTFDRDGSGEIEYQELVNLVFEGK